MTIAAVVFEWNEEIRPSESVCGYWMLIFVVSAVIYAFLHNLFGQSGSLTRFLRNWKTEKKVRVEGILEN